MAEYIDKNKLNKKKKYLFQTKGMPFPKSEYFIKVDDFQDIPAADVVERSEYEKLLKENEKLKETIKNCIEEINNAEIEVDFMNDHSDGFNSGLFKALEIIKENTGKENESDYDRI